jgi:hypothetical protein
MGVRAAWKMTKAMLGAVVLCTAMVPVRSQVVKNFVPVTPEMLLNPSPGD